MVFVEVFQALGIGGASLTTIEYIVLGGTIYVLVDGAKKVLSAAVGK